MHSGALLSSPPPARTAQQNNPTLLVSWWCTGFALAIILVRLAGRYIRLEKLFAEDKIMALSIIPLCARMAFVHVVLLWGTNNAIVNSRWTPQDIHHREIGSRLVLASRIMYALFLWVAKFSMSEFLKRLTSAVWRRQYEIGLQAIRWFLGITFVAVLIATLAECQPFPHYWQVEPDPGPKCRQGMAQLITMGTADVITDLVLVIFPIPIVLRSSMVPKRKISLVLLFALSLILVAITLYRVIGVIDRHADQQFRSLLASLEILAAAAVSNAIVLGSFVRDRGVKKQRFRYGSTTRASSQEHGGTLTPKRTITARDWGSDADLVGGLGMRCAPELTENQPRPPRPAPIALPTAEQANALTPAPVAGRDWSYRPNDSVYSDDAIDLEKSPDTIAQLRPNHFEVPSTPRGMSFFDVGGLLNEELGSPHSALMRSRQHSVAGPASGPNSPVEESGFGTARRHSTAPPSRRPGPLPLIGTTRESTGSHALLEDIGGLLGPSSPTSPFHHSHHHGYHRQHSDKPPNDDVGTGADVEKTSLSEEKIPESPVSSLDSVLPPPPSAPEVHRDISLVDVLRENPPPDSMKPLSSRQAALQRMWRRDRSAADGSGNGDSVDPGSGSDRGDDLGLRDVGGLLK